MGAIVGFDDQRWSVLDEEAGEGAGGGWRIGVGHGQRIEDAARGEVADDKDVGEDAVDGPWRIGVVHGPHRPWAGPSERATMDSTTFVVDAQARAPEEPRQLPAGDAGEVVNEGWNADVDAVQQQEISDGTTLTRCRVSGRSAERAEWRPQSGAPISERPHAKPELAAEAAIVPAAPACPAGEDDGTSSHQPFAFPLGALGGVATLVDEPRSAPGSGAGAGADEAGMASGAAGVR